MRREDGAGASGRKLSAGRGRGVSALLGEMEAIGPAHPPGQGVEAIAISAIIPNQRKPRRKFDATKLDALAESIKAQGLLQPILVRPLSRIRYEIVPAARRWRAAQSAGLHEIQAVIRQLGDATGLELALVEDIQRAAHYPTETARGHPRRTYAYGPNME